MLCQGTPWLRMGRRMGEHRVRDSSSVLFSFFFTNVLPVVVTYQILTFAVHQFTQERFATETARRSQDRDSSPRRQSEGRRVHP
jgi:hypothetical protein